MAFRRRSSCRASSPQMRRVSPTPTRSDGSPPVVASPPVEFDPDAVAAAGAAPLEDPEVLDNEAAEVVVVVLFVVVVVDGESEAVAAWASSC